MTLTLYGIPNCDTMKKARVWLDTAGVAYSFHDYKKLGIGAEVLARWCDALGWETILNRAGTTFKKLPEGDKDALDQSKAVLLMLAQPSTIKRPVLEGAKANGERLLVIGFKPEIYAAQLTA